jgi:hypothetical protein
MLHTVSDAVNVVLGQISFPCNYCDFHNLFLSINKITGNGPLSHIGGRRREEQPFFSHRNGNKTDTSELMLMGLIPRLEISLAGDGD